MTHLTAIVSGAIIGYALCVAILAPEIGRLLEQVRVKDRQIAAMRGWER